MVSDYMFTILATIPAETSNSITIVASFVYSGYHAWYHLVAITKTNLILESF